jgi:integrase
MANFLAISGPRMRRHKCRLSVKMGRLPRRAVTVQQLLGHSAITVTTRYTHTNLDSKHAAVAKLEKFGDNLVTVCTKLQQSTSQLSLNAL